MHIWLNGSCSIDSLKEIKAAVFFLYIVLIGRRSLLVSLQPGCLTDASSHTSTLPGPVDYFFSRTQLAFCVKRRNKPEHWRLCAVETKLLVLHCDDQHSSTVAHQIWFHINTVQPITVIIIFLLSRLLLFVFFSPSVLHECTICASALRVMSQVFDM